MNSNSKKTAQSLPLRKQTHPPSYKAERPISEEVVAQALAFRPNEYKDFLEKLNRQFNYQSWERMEKLFVELLRYLVVRAENPSATLPPSDHIWLVWREFFLFSRDYHAFCQFLGHFVHFEPLPSKTTQTDETQKSVNGRFERVWNDLYPSYNPTPEHWDWMTESTRDLCRKIWKRRSDCFA